ncbi:unnamed protein product [Amoebophrya sp. A25]|nr:unnamed protein product [Amoebophrya sp. A25]|eukprot:GSA25T00023715001.1
MEGLRDDDTPPGGYISSKRGFVTFVPREQPKQSVTTSAPNPKDGQSTQNTLLVPNQAAQEVACASLHGQATTSLHGHHGRGHEDEGTSSTSGSSRCFGKTTTLLEYRTPAEQVAEYPASSGTTWGTTTTTIASAASAASSIRLRHGAFPEEQGQDYHATLSANATSTCGRSYYNEQEAAEYAEYVAQCRAWQEHAEGQYAEEYKKGLEKRFGEHSVIAANLPIGTTAGSVADFFYQRCGTVASVNFVPQMQHTVAVVEFEHVEGFENAMERGYPKDLNGNAVQVRGCAEIRQDLHVALNTGALQA